MQTEEKQFSSQSIAGSIIARSAWVFGYNLNTDHEAALIEDAEFNKRALIATREALESAAITPLAVLADTAEEPELSSDDIAQHAISAVMDFFYLTREQAAARLAMIDFKAYAQVEGV